MAVVHRIPRYRLLVLHRCMVVPTVTLIFMHLPPTMLRMGSFALPSRIKQDIKIQYKSAATSSVPFEEWRCQFPIPSAGASTGYPFAKS